MVISPADRDLKDTPSVVDTPALLERCMGERESAVMLLGMFRDRLPSILTQIRSGLGDLSDVPTLTRMIHTLKGNAGNLGAQRLYHAAARLEQAMRSQQFAETHHLFASIEQESAALLQQLPAVIESLS